MNTKICTSIKQSKKLIELGVDVKTANMYYQWYSETESALHVGKGSKKLNADCPAWSLSALLGLIEWDYNLEKTLFDQSNYFTYSIVCKDLDFRTYEYDDPIDAAFEMVCWLKENEKL